MQYSSYPGCTRTFNGYVALQLTQAFSGVISCYSGPGNYYPLYPVPAGYVITMQYNSYTGCGRDYSYTVYGVAISTPYDALQLTQAFSGVISCFGPEYLGYPIPAGYIITMQYSSHAGCGSDDKDGYDALQLTQAFSGVISCSGPEYPLDPIPAGYVPTKQYSNYPACGGNDAVQYSLASPGMNLSGANLSGDDLSGDDLDGTDLDGTDLDGTDLDDTDLNDADLNDASLIDASLIDADLDPAKLRGANLSGANLSGANLNGVNLSGVNLRGANLRGANPVSYTHLDVYKRQLPRSPPWPKTTDRCNSACSTRATWPSSPIPTTRANGSSRVAIHCWPKNASGNAASSWSPPKRPSPPLSLRFKRDASLVPTRSGSRSAS